ncbi:response regulator transcription factor [Anaerocolumna sp. MB42-C2]|uniref:response regulator transcription factor n=1 Tax=Anaerocolumna sp. MB42-C2 TaxID=3070997 RepID=UPI0027E13BB7|nr:response regulator [Anaerocolumna sp. MB42-C2]WMJ88991.1 response regulator [Anaerocolumna sp. MB42-C2]
MSSSFKILLVDDQRFVLEGLIEQLNWERFQGVLCGSAANGIQAMEYLKTCCPDAIISDIKMPFMDGIELAKHVDESPELSGIPVILLSGYREFEYAKSAMKYHVNHYILKPVTRQKIEQLEDILTELYQARESSRSKLIELTEYNYQKEISLALNNHDISKIEDFFHSRLYQECMSGKYCDLMGGGLLNLLFDFLSDLRVNSEAIQSSRSHTLESFYELPNSASKLNYVETTFFDMLNLLNHQKSSNTDALYRYALQHIEEHFTDSNFNISFLATKMNITLSYLSTIFKQSAGTNLNVYITGKRLEHAKKLLKDPQYTISEVAHLSGYEDPGYFSSLFRKKIGMNPSEYRNCQL